MAAPDALWDLDTGEFVAIATDAQFVSLLGRERRSAWLDANGAVFDESAPGRRHIQMRARRREVFAVGGDDSDDDSEDAWREAWANAQTKPQSPKTARRSAFEAVLYPGIWVVGIALLLLIVWLTQGHESSIDNQRDYPDTCYGRQGAFNC